MLIQQEKICVNKHPLILKRMTHLEFNVSRWVMFSLWVGIYFVTGYGDEGRLFQR